MSTNKPSTTELIEAVIMFDRRTNTHQVAYRELLERDEAKTAAIATLQAKNARLRVLLARAADGLECAAHDLYSHNLDGTRYAQDVKAARALLDAE